MEFGCIDAEGSRRRLVELVPDLRNLALIFLPGIPITDPHYWHDENECTLESLRHVFRSCTDEEMPLLQERLECLREAGRVLYEVSLW